MHIIRAALLMPALATMLFASCAITSRAKETTEFPDNEIAALADQIEEVVLNTNFGQPSAADVGSEQADADIEDFEPLNLIVDTEEIERRVPALSELKADSEIMLSAIRSRIMRRPAVAEFKQKGCLGESRSGFLQNVKGDLCSGDRHMKDRVAYIILLENRDRRIIYEETAKAVGLKSSDTGRIQTIFAEQIYKKAWAGTPLQMPDGGWERR